MHHSISYKAADELARMSTGELTGYIQQLMIFQDEIQEKKLEAKAEINARNALEKLDGLSEGQKHELARHILGIRG